MEQLWSGLLTTLGVVFLGALGSAVFHYAREPAERLGGRVLERLRRFVNRGIELSEAEVEKIAGTPGLVAILVGQFVVRSAVMLSSIMFTSVLSGLFMGRVTASLFEAKPFPDFWLVATVVFCLMVLWLSCWIFFAKYARTQSAIRAVWRHYYREPIAANPASGKGGRA